MRSLQKQIDNLFLLFAALMTGMFGFAGYIAYDRKKSNQEMRTEIHRGDELLRKVLVERAKEDKTLAEILHRFGMM